MNEEFSKFNRMEEKNQKQCQICLEDFMKQIKFPKFLNMLQNVLNYSLKR
jgi:hypothetical protein